MAPIPKHLYTESNQLAQSTLPGRRLAGFAMISEEGNFICTSGFSFRDLGTAEQYSRLRELEVYKKRIQLP